MNKHIVITADPDSKTVTPWPRGPEVHPSLFVAGAANQWPGLPRLAAVTPHIEKSDRKAIAGILERYDAAVALREKHNIPGMAQAVRDAERNAGSYDTQAVLCETLKRELAAMDPAAFHAAVAAIHGSKVGAGIFAAKLAERISAKLFAEFEIEALSAEGRYSKYEQPLETKVYRDEWQDIFVMHSDPILSGLYLEAWYLANYFPAEMRSPKMWNGSSVEWLRDITAD